MAEAREEVPSLPPEGRVQEVRRQFSVAEDGVLAYKIQEKEIEEHYGMNRHHRRTVRQDIPVAKVVQTQEEIEQQKERLRKLAALQAQAEADEIVARRINRQVQDEVRRDEVVRALEDEELARLLQEKEKAKYEKYLEKKRERRLKKEREKLEQQLARTTEEARLSLRQSNGSNADQARQDMEALRLQGASPSNGITRYQCRVTPAGRIEDEGDFSDFFAVPPDNLDPLEWEQMQQQQDEELARLLQEQEHKRSKAEVDKDKLREIELRDEQLAAIIQEQERMKERKYKLKRQQLKEQQRLQRQQAGLEGLPLGASANMLSQMHSSKSPATTDHNHHRYRRNSYTKSIDNGPAPLDYGSDGGGVDHRGMPVSRSMGSGGGLDGRPQMPLPQNQGPVHRTVIEVSNPHPGSAASQPPPRRQIPSTELSPDDAPEVLRWLQSQGAPVVAPPYDSDPHRGQRLSPTRDLCDEEVSGLSSQANSFNIATAIDPTYHRRQNQRDDMHAATQMKTVVPVSRSLPLADTPTSADSSHHDSSFDDGSQSGGFQPVQGQKRSTLDTRNRKARKPNMDPKGGKNSSCKQQ